MKHERRRARSLALQALYEIDCVGHAAGEVVARMLASNATLGEDGALFMQRLVMGVLGQAEALDAQIATCAPEWPVDQLAIVDRNILRIALWELAVANETPVKVAINEAVELAKRFGSESAPRFINGVLGSLVERESELRRQLQPAG
jgi:N utilization substance protein B